jgi:shikimate dehydrogenase
MHGAALAALGLDGWRYQALPAPPALLAELVRALPGAGFRGANATIPHKEAALGAADRATPAARAIGAANTLIVEPDGTIEADNTDAPGLLAALPASPAGRTALVLGAGGSARAAAWALREAGAEVAVWNRTPERARALATELGVRAVERAEPAELLVNCTAVGLRGEAPAAALPLAHLPTAKVVVDLVYGARETELARAARAAGAEVVDGLEVLVRQGAFSLERWTGRAAPLAAMRAAVAPGG